MTREGLGGGFKRVIRRGTGARSPRRRAPSPEGAAARMAPARRPAGARLLLVCAGLLAAAAGFVSPEPGEPAESRARQEPRPGNELPAENRAGPPARPPVRRRTPSGLGFPTRSARYPHPDLPEIPGRGGGTEGSAASRAETGAGPGVRLPNVRWKRVAGGAPGRRGECGRGPSARTGAGRANLGRDFGGSSAALRAKFHWLRVNRLFPGVGAEGSWEVGKM